MTVIQYCYRGYFEYKPLLGSRWIFDFDVNDEGQLLLSMKIEEKTSIRKSVNFRL